ncbi:hypothetical protein GCM10023189_11030 [Nibrella saemangeumensis]|uniref:histidine kinase n=1 Tax=Nibrella saemangeumensis TaxID=1084526 RepID=A0ABP8MH83_9BACT
MRLSTKLALYNTGIRLLLVGIAGGFWPTPLTWVYIAGAAVILGLAYLIDLGYTHFLLRPLRMLISRKLRIIQDPSYFDYSPLPTTTTDLRLLNQHINDLMRQLNIRFECEKAFTAYASHELLTPITVLRNRFDNLITNSQTPSQVAIRLVESQQTLLQLSNIVQKLLRLARIENHQYVKDEQVSIRSVVLEVLQDLDDRIALKNVSVDLDFKEDILVSEGNHSLLYTMLSNLIRNAIRYNSREGRLTLTQALSGTQATLSITDTGPGMTADQITTLKEYGRPPKATGKGNGIGLQLIRTIAAFHNIGLTVNSVAGQGTSITLNFQPS